MFLAGQKPFFISGPTGQLESTAMLPSKMEAVAIICHPHPLYDGSMNNKVTYAIARSLRDLGAASLRFNFRGVGLSEGQYDNGEGETEDLLAVIRYVKKRAPNMPIWLAGFSFGAYISLKAASAVDCDRLLVVAPPVNFFNFSGISLPDCPSTVIQGNDDEVVPAEKVYQWVSDLEPSPEVIQLDGVGHFFNRRLNDLRRVIEDSFVEDMQYRMAVG
ncbi:MAG: alpha/beta hydrolase [Gammaproteobacteria bacterium]|nr:alpha/beta hydrolase [Gammaproteobacteria bacterium]